MRFNNLFIFLSLLSLLKILFFPSFVNAEQKSPPGKGFGVCHWAAPSGMGYSDSTVNWFYGLGGEYWSNIEKTKDVYSFTQLNQDLDYTFSQYPKAYFWLNLNTAMPQAVPEWAKQDTSLEYLEIYSGASAFPIWNKAYQQRFEKLLTETSKYIYSGNFKYKDKIKAIVMMSGGLQGEMIYWSNCDQSPSCRENPAQCNHGYSCRKWLDAGYTDDVYYDAYVNWLAPLYVRLFPTYPLVIQLGGGIYGNNIGERIANAVVDKFNKSETHIYVKWNGWNRKFGQDATPSDIGYHTLLESLSDRAPVGFEPGTNWAIPDDESEATRNSIDQSIMATLNKVPVSFFCLQEKYYKILTSEQLVKYSRNLRGLQKQYPPFGNNSPIYTSIPLITTSPSCLCTHNKCTKSCVDWNNISINEYSCQTLKNCSTAYSRTKGDSTGDGKTCLNDYIILIDAFRGKYDNDLTTFLKSDFNGNGYVDDGDMRIFKTRYEPNLCETKF